MRLFLDISFPLAVPKPSFTYHFDTPAEPDLAKGLRIVAPVNRRPHIGYLVGWSMSPPAFDTLPIQEILDQTPLLPASLVDLGFHLARTCLCSPGEAFDAMLPGAVRQKIRQVVFCPLPDSLSATQLAALPEAIAWLRTQGRIGLRAFLDAYPSAMRLWRGWQSEGLLGLEHERRDAAGPRLERKLYLTPNLEIRLEAFTPKEKLVIEYLLKISDAATPASICRGAGVSSAPVHQLIRKGFLQERTDRVVREAASGDYYTAQATPMPSLTDDQSAVLATIRKACAEDRRPVLIRGVTCSGKTEVYLRWVAEMLSQNRGAIVLVPEISLTPQMTKRFRDRFGQRVAILHSRLSDGERFDQWELIRRGERPVVVGARSAVFAPVPRLGTIILDEEGEPSFKQSETPRYHARDVAVERCRLEQAQLVMGTATPTLESYHLASTGAYHLVHMEKRIGDRAMPIVQVVDMRQELTARKNRSVFSSALQSRVSQALTAGKQIILYLNRRGYSSFVLCRACGTTIECSRCKVSLVYHQGCRLLRCHYCGEARAIPTQCPSCGSASIRFFGAGTQRIEAEAHRLFPGARIERLDSDNVGPKGNLEEILHRFGEGRIDMLIGTQMVAKGLDFPNVTVVGIMAADSLLRLPDYRAGERNFSLLAQVAGRAGRGDAPGHVVLQTYFPEHHSIKHALTENFLGFFHEELEHRRALAFPPFSHLGLFLLSGERPDRVEEAGKALAEKLKHELGTAGGQVLGPSPAPIEVIEGRHRFQVLAKHADLETMTQAVARTLAQTRVSGVHVSIDFDPYITL